MHDAHTSPSSYTTCGAFYNLSADEAVEYVQRRASCRRTMVDLGGGGRCCRSHFVWGVAAKTQECEKYAPKSETTSTCQISISAQLLAGLRFRIQFFFRLRILFYAHTIVIWKHLLYVCPTLCFVQQAVLEPRFHLHAQYKRQFHTVEFCTDVAMPRSCEM